MKFVKVKVKRKTPITFQVVETQNYDCFYCGIVLPVVVLGV